MPEESIKRDSGRELLYLEGQNIKKDVDPCMLYKPVQRRNNFMTTDENSRAVLWLFEIA